MKYRITLDEKNGYRAEVGKLRRGCIEYIPIEQDNPYMASSKRYYDNTQDAIDACKKHHYEKGYDKLPKVVEEFEL